MNSQQSIIFFGTPEFAVASLDALLNANYSIKAIVTTPDKPSGRGKKITASPLKNYALDHQLTILQPENLSDQEFLHHLETLNADLFIVVAFRKLPLSVWGMPRLGTFNLHASLLPDYRGAAPINWAIINGEKETGLTTFFLNEKIDEGKIIYTEKTNIGEEESFGELYDRLKILGSRLVLKTVETIFSNKVETVDQKNLLRPTIPLNNAPKILKPDCKINWERKSKDIYNKIRGLSPSPAANTILVSDKAIEYYIKIFKAEAEIAQHEAIAGQIITDHKNFLKIASNDGYVFLTEIQVSGKNKMSILEFLRGYAVNSNWKAF